LRGGFGICIPKVGRKGQLHLAPRDRVEEEKTQKTQNFLVHKENRK
jgi:hypothetical protein